MGLNYIECSRFNKYSPPTWTPKATPSTVLAQRPRLEYYRKHLSQTTVASDLFRVKRNLARSVLRWSQGFAPATRHNSSQLVFKEVHQPFVPNGLRLCISWMHQLWGWHPYIKIMFETLLLWRFSLSSFHLLLDLLLLFLQLPRRCPNSLRPPSGCAFCWCTAKSSFQKFSMTLLRSICVSGQTTSFSMHILGQGCLQMLANEEVATPVQSPPLIVWLCAHAVNTRIA